MKTIERTALQSALADGKPLKILEALPPKYFHQGRLPGAKQLDFANAVAHAQRLRLAEADRIVVYCASDTCANSHDAAAALTAAGYRDIAVYVGGKKDWSEAGLPLEGARRRLTSKSEGRRLRRLSLQRGVRPIVAAEETLMPRQKPGQGQTALITGASAGIGVDLAECFARDGYDLILTARSQGPLQELASRLAQAHGVKAHAIAQDLGAIGGGSALANAIKAKGLEVDVVVNNAGYGHAGALTSSDLNTQLGMIDLNVRALVELTYLYWDRMLANKRGGVLNVASTAAFQPGPLMANYYASKAYVLSFSEALWEEARGTGVHVSCLCPGPTVSKFRERAGTGKTRLAENAGAAMASAPVAQQGYRGFRDNKRVVVTGARNAFQAGMVKYLPRETLLRIVRNLQSPA